MSRPVFADLPCADLAASTEWFADLLGRDPDARHSGDLAEWHHPGTAGLRLRRDRDRAGQGALTLVVADIATRRERLIRLESGVTPDAGRLRVQLRDPDGNLVGMTGD